MATNTVSSPGVYNLVFTFFGVKAFPAPAVTLGIKNVKHHLTVLVTNAIGEPQEGVAVEFECPGYPNGTGISDAKGFARNSVETAYTENLFYLINARVKSTPNTIVQMLMQFSPF